MFCDKVSYRIINTQSRHWLVEPSKKTECLKTFQYCHEIQFPVYWDKKICIAGCKFSIRSAAVYKKVKEHASKYNLFGEWSAHCARPIALLLT